MAKEDKLEQAKMLYKDANEAQRYVLECLFPELAESEDERIKKGLIKGLSAMRDIHKHQTFSDDTININDAIDWLERQGETDKTSYEIAEKQSEEKEYTFKSIPRLLDMIEPTDRAKAYCQKLIDTLAKEGYNTDAKIVEDVLKGWNGEDVPMAVMDEKQGEQKPILDFKAKDWYVSKVDGKIHNIYHSVDKVEPKFKVGDWVIFAENHTSVYQVERMDNNRYYLRHYLGGTLSVYFDNDLIRPWTIQDAKDGDVFSDGTTIFIFKDLLSDGSVMSYCDYDTDSGESDAFCPLTMNLMCSKITPATKEQRDLLFQKMKKAGYEWDAENKELKKENLSDFESALFTAFSDAWQQYLLGEKVNVAQWAKEHSSELIEIAKQNDKTIA